MPSSPSSLTTHLLSLSPSALHRATTHPFLPLAATAALPTPTLQSWLAQDRLYACSYVSFISSLLSHLPLPPSSPTRPSTLPWRIADALIDSLTNIRAELALFESTASRAGWLSAIAGNHVRPTPTTRAYADLFAAAAAPNRPPLVGLTVLWATEECYLRAWRFAASHLPSSGGSAGQEGEGGGEGGVEGKGTGEAGDVMQKVFIPNWSSEGFGKYVGVLRGLVDELAQEEMENRGMERDGWVWRECEGVWEQVLALEEAFWPEV